MKLARFLLHLPGTALLLALAAVPARAQVRSVTLVLDNDAFDFWIPVDTRPDWDYTSGVDLSMELAGGPLWARALAPRAAHCTGVEPADSACAATTLAFGQKIFTPRVDNSSPVPGERAYAGWLYLSAAAHLQTAARQRTVAVEVGVTGPPSLAEAVHAGWHQVAGFHAPEGWDGQLRFEPGLVARYDERRLLADVRAGGVRLATLAPAWGADVGNVHTGAHAEVALRTGYAVPHPWSAAADRGAPPTGIYGIARVRGDAVARDLFLDGNTFGGGPRVSRRPLQWEYELGVGARCLGVTLEYRAITQSRQYATQRTPHAWATFEITYRLR
jgi:lipid A 3-O-deacylase